METLLNTTVFHFGGADITGRHLTEAFAVLLAACLIVYLVNRWVTSVFRGRGLTNTEDIKEYTRSVRTLILIVGVAYALHILGFKLTALFAAGGLFAIVSGLAFKGVLEGYVSGITLKLEHNIRRGDVIELGGATGIVRRIGTRSSTVHLYDGSVLVVPNTHLIQTTVRNITLLSQGLHRIYARVGVSYKSDMKEVMEVLRRVAAEQKWRSDQKDPWITMTEFGDSAVVFDVYVWIEDADSIMTFSSKLHEVVWDALREAGIVIAYPQLDVHLPESN